MYGYRQLMINGCSVYIVNNVFFTVTILIFRVRMDVFLDLLRCGCCVDIQHYEVYNILSKETHLYETGVTLLY
jgi:hypothetical protein